MKQSRFLRILLVVLVSLLVIQFTGRVWNVSAGDDLTWNTNVNVDPDTTHVAGLAGPSIAVDRFGNVYIAWFESYSPNNIYIAKSTDQGETWNAKKRVNDSDYSFPNWVKLTADMTGNIYLVWEDKRDGVSTIYFSKSEDGGSTWSRNNKISDAPVSVDAWAPSLAVGNTGNLYVAWTDKRAGYWDNYFSKSTDGGTTWSTGVKVNNDISLTTKGRPSSLEVDKNGTLYLTWSTADGGNDLYSSKSTDGGQSWSASSRINDMPGSVWLSSAPGFALDKIGNLYVIWPDTREGGGWYNRVYFSKSTDGGENWSPNVRISTNSIYSFEYSHMGLVLGSDDCIYAMWGDNRADNSPDLSWDYDVYFATSIDGGDVWSANTKVNDDGAVVPQSNVSLVIDKNDNLYAVWQDYRNGYSEIYTSTLKHPNQPPEISTLSAPITPVKLGQSITVTVEFSDPDVGDMHTVLWEWGDGSTTITPATVPSVTTNHIYMSAGVYSLTATVTDALGEFDTETFQYVVAYDPNSGFVTGSGWITSPLGAYTLNPSLVGKATFGFVSKYQKGANVPTGNTEFQFHVADLNFKSTSYDWLVIAGSKAQYKGTGTINGTREYKFMLTAIDGSPDKFRIKIWDEVTGEVIYDNQLGATNTANPTTAIQGGSIVIHK